MENKLRMGSNPFSTLQILLSTSGLGRNPLKVETRVRISLGVLFLHIKKLQEHIQHILL